VGTITDDGFPTAATITWTWSFVSGPAGASVTGPTGTGTGVGPIAANATANLTTGGIYVFRLTASEAGGLTCSDDCVITLSSVTTIWTGPRLITTENQTTATFQVVLTKQPTAGQVVNVTLTSSDATEGELIDPATGLPATTISIQFNDVNWSTPQTVTLRGVDDTIRDFDIDYQVNLAVGAGSDPTFAGTIIQPVLATNQDNDIPGITISPASGLVTTESGGTAQFQIRLRSAPNGTVTVNFVSSNPTEGTVAPPSITFTNAAGSWDTPQTIVVTGVDDSIIDLDVRYTIITSVDPSTTDAEYLAINPVDVSCINRDNEAIPKADKVWGCGLMGLDGLAGLAALLLWRRRRRA
jgi:hypothetical protein